MRIKMNIPDDVKELHIQIRMTNRFWGSGSMGIEPGASCMLGKLSTTELHPLLLNYSLILLLSIVILNENCTYYLSE